MKNRVFLIVSAVSVLLINSAAYAADAAAMGEKLYLSKGCIGCHGPGGKSATPQMYPSTAGLEANYIIEQIKAFKDGTRKNPMMSPMAMLVSEDEAANIAAFLAAQPKPGKK